MKGTTWLCPIVTLLYASRFVCTAQQGYSQEYFGTNMIQDNYLQEKRSKPSLSIVNPLDVLRQRLLLEIARRQMKENTRQVEINRAILKNVGKRLAYHHRHLAAYRPPSATPYLQENPSSSSSSIFNFVRSNNQNGQQQLDNLSDNDLGFDADNEIENGRISHNSNNNKIATGRGDDDDVKTFDNDDNGYAQLRYLFRLHKHRLGWK